MYAWTAPEKFLHGFRRRDLEITRGAFLVHRLLAAEEMARLVRSERGGIDIMRHRHEPQGRRGLSFMAHAIGLMEMMVRDFLSDWRRWTLAERIAAALMAALLAVLLPAGPLLLTIG